MYTLHTQCIIICTCKYTSVCIIYCIICLYVHSILLLQNVATFSIILCMYKCTTLWTQWSYNNTGVWMDFTVCVNCWSCDGHVSQLIFILCNRATFDWLVWPSCAQRLTRGKGNIDSKPCTLYWVYTVCTYIQCTNVHICARKYIYIRTCTILTNWSLRKAIMDIRRRYIVRPIRAWTMTV